MKKLFITLSIALLGSMAPVEAAYSRGGALYRGLKPSVGVGVGVGALGAMKTCKELEEHLLALKSQAENETNSQKKLDLYNKSIKKGRATLNRVCTWKNPMIKRRINKLITDTEKARRTSSSPFGQRYLK